MGGGYFYSLRLLHRDAIGLADIQVRVHYAQSAWEVPVASTGTPSMKPCSMASKNTQDLMVLRRSFNCSSSFSNLSSSIKAEGSGKLSVIAFFSIVVGQLQS